MEIFFCQNCEKAMLDGRKYTMYEGLCKECYYRRVYQADMTPEQIDWIQPKEDTQKRDALLREIHKDFNER